MTYFNEDGTHDMETFGTQTNFSFAKDSVSPYQTAGLFFMSGNLVTAPIPDENGNVTVYVNKKDYYFTMMTDFGWQSGGGGGTTGMGGYADSKAVFSFSTPSVPENGFALKNLPEGEYTVKSADFPDKYESYSGTFTVTNEPGSGVPECRIVIRNKKFALNIISENGTVTADAVSEGKVSAESKVTLSCTPDEGYRFAGYEVSDADGSISLSDDYSFEMPYSDVTVRALFDEIYAGDLDGNGCINAADFLYMAKYLTGVYGFPDEGWYKAADMNGDGTVNIADYVLLRSRLLV